MAKYSIENTTLTNIANEVRTVTGSTGSMTPAAMQSNLRTFDNDMTSVVNEQDNLVAQIAAALEGKMVPPSAPVVETCRVKIRFAMMLGDVSAYIYYLDSEMVVRSIYVESWGSECELEVVKHSILYTSGMYYPSLTFDNLNNVQIAIEGILTQINGDVEIQWS